MLYAVNLYDFDLSLNLQFVLFMFKVHIQNIIILLLNSAYLFCYLNILFSNRFK